MKKHTQVETWNRGHERFKRGRQPLLWQMPLRNTRREGFPAHRRHTVECVACDEHRALSSGGLMASRSAVSDRDPPQRPMKSRDQTYTKNPHHHQGGFVEFS